MRIKINFSLPNQLVLPLAYHHIVQGFLYQCLSENPRFSEFVHEKGYGEERSYKLFCFSTLKGIYTIKQNQIVFRDKITLEVGSVSDEFISILCTTLIQKKEFQLYHQAMNLESFYVSNEQIEKIEIFVRMLSPVTVHRTIVEDGKKKTIYYTPWDWEFEDLIVENALRKYITYYGEEINDSISIFPVQVTERDKYVTKFKGQTIIAGWKGIYRLVASEQLLNFLYQTGIGDRNSQGFGMFELYRELEER